MPYTDLEKLNFRACCEIIASHGKNEVLREYARAGMKMRDDETISAQCEYILSNMTYERLWKESRLTPKEARLTLRHMIKRSKYI